MRDPARIDEMLEILREVWLQEPDLRLGQLIFNAARMREPGLQDIYSVEDSTLRIGLVRYMELIKSQGANSP